MDLSFSFIIPVFNRPEEIRELLESMRKLEYKEPFEVVIVEDGSSLDSEAVVATFSNELEISYYKKQNTGPGDSRNYGMKKAKGTFFLILDSDVILPPDYLLKVGEELENSFTHCFGGRDSAHATFSEVQKAINYAMTSFFTTGGIRGNKRMIGKFQPRSFNMGLSKKAFVKTGGFGSIHPGEDPDLALRLWKLGFETRFFPNVVVFHKRRIDWGKFYQQVYKFGLVRPILNKWHPGSDKITFWFPTFFSAGLLLSVLLALWGFTAFLFIYVGYMIFILIDASVHGKSIKIGIYSLWASLIQFFGYGLGFCRSTYYIRMLKEDPQVRFPKLFFKNVR